MKKISYLILILTFTIFNCGKSQNFSSKVTNQSELKNKTIKKHIFLDCMYKDSYFPKVLVDKCKNVLINLCESIEKQKPGDLASLYKLTQNSTIEINNLQDEFYKNNSEIETGARECLGADFEFISKSYGFDADVEELIATREW